MAANPTPAIPVQLRTVVVVIAAPQRPVITDHMQVTLVVLQQMKADAMVPISAQPHVLAKKNLQGDTDAFPAFASPDETTSTRVPNMPSTL